MISTIIGFAGGLAVGYFFPSIYDKIKGLFN